MRTFRTAVACLFAASLATTASAVVYSQASAEPIALSVIDTGGDLASTQVILENYKKANPDKVKEIRIQRAPASGAARQDQGAAGCRPARHQSGYDGTGRRARCSLRNQQHQSRSRTIERASRATTSPRRAKALL